MNKIIEIKDVSFQYKGSKEGLLNHVSLSVWEGEVLLLCGASGCGKTTLIRLMNGLIPQYYPGHLEGQIQVAGYDLNQTPLYELAGVVGTVFQNPRSQFFSVDTDGEIVFGPENIGVSAEEIGKRKEAVVREFHLEDLLERNLFALSGGEKQKIACASVSALLPQVVLLDEPSSNLDMTAMEELRKAIVNWKSQGKTIVIAEHRLWYLKGLVDRVLYLEEGKILREWQGDAFFSMEEKELTDFKLRPTVRIPLDLTKNKEEEFVENHLNLRNFQFSYEKKKNFFQRKKEAHPDPLTLTLNIPSLELPVGKVIGVLGRNGTGKSTFLRCLCGLEKDCPGVIEFQGVDYKTKARLGKCYMVMQDVNHQLFTDSVAAEVLLSMDKEDPERCDAILRQLGLFSVKEKHPMALSGGQKQRVAVASALAAGAKLLLFDEPTSGLDYVHMEIVGKLLQELAKAGCTVLVSTHDYELVEQSCDYVLYLEDGRVKDFFCLKK